ncbi:MAG: NAD(P)/FAD-dependent oxidoreductase [Zetaproteobacteria bacterium]|nr:NAD(P)/FAD-dependent oxidoreductase [Zetaproteobacteria bacterium]
MGNKQDRPLVIVGGGAAGYFASIQSAQRTSRPVVLLEATRVPLKKVKISGGGRCNVTHHCFDPVQLVKNYPRGAKELRGPFSRFQPRDTCAWFESQGVRLKTESDGRMFSVTDSSQTIIDCLRRAADAAGVEVRLGALVKEVAPDPKGGFVIHCRGQGPLYAHKLLLATGSAPLGYKIAASLGHTITDLVPSLFTFGLKDTRIAGLAGLGKNQVALSLTVEGRKRPFTHVGPLLITHWGFSGPAVLKLSAFAARELFACNYAARLHIDWLPEMSAEDLSAWFCQQKEQAGRKQIAKNGLSEIPKRLWQSLLQPVLQTQPALIFAQLSTAKIRELVSCLKKSSFYTETKGVFKDEFVTCGGIKLKEINFQTMASKKNPDLFLAGEILDIDGITGGFNFQNAWTTGYIAGCAMAEES